MEDDAPRYSPLTGIGHQDATEPLQHVVRELVDASLMFGSAIRTGHEMLLTNLKFRVSSCTRRSDTGRRQVLNKSTAYTRLCISASAQRHFSKPVDSYFICHWKLG
jgi:hypothetical protein